MRVEDDVVRCWNCAGLVLAKGPGNGKGGRSRFGRVGTTNVGDGICCFFETGDDDRAFSVRKLDCSSSMSKLLFLAVANGEFSITSGRDDPRILTSGLCPLAARTLQSGC